MRAHVRKQSPGFCELLGLVQLGHVSQFALGKSLGDLLRLVQKNKTSDDPNQVPSSKPPVDVDLKDAEEGNVCKDQEHIVVLVELRGGEAVEHELGKNHSGQQAEGVTGEKRTTDSAEESHGNGNQPPEAEVLRLLSEFNGVRSVDHVFGKIVKSVDERSLCIANARNTEYAHTWPVTCAPKEMNREQLFTYTLGYPYTVGYVYTARASAMNYEQFDQHISAFQA